MQTWVGLFGDEMGLHKIAVHSEHVQMTTLLFLSLQMFSVQVTPRIRNGVRNAWWEVEAYDRLCHKQDRAFSMQGGTVDRDKMAQEAQSLRGRLDLFAFLHAVFRNV